MPAQTNSYHNPKDKENQKNREYIDKAINTALKNKEITKEDEKLIKKFVVHATVNHAGDVGAYKITRYLLTWRKYLKPFRQNTIEDIELAAGKYKKNSGHADNYQRVAIYYLKRFYHYLVSEKQVELDTERLDKIKMPRANPTNLTREMLLTRDEIEQLIKACHNSMERAMISSLYYGAFRGIEIRTLTWKQVNMPPGKKCVVYNVRKKTGRQRQVPVVDALPYMAQWRQDYPGSAEGDNHVFIDKYKRPFNYNSFETRIKRIAARSGVKKNVRSHLPRHSRITELRVNGVSDGSIMQFGWGGETDMLQTYSHLTSTDVEKEILEMSGVEEKQEVENTKSRICPECGTVNGPSHECCCQCGHPLTEKAKRHAMDIGQLIREALANDKTIIVEALREDPELLKRLG
jgi:site-specific recombinase XerD